MSLAYLPALGGAFSSIPSPSVSFFEIGPLRIHIYALCIMVGIIVAVVMTNSRLSRRGGEPWVVIDIAIFAVPLAIIGARIFHVLTHPNFYFGVGRNTWNPFEHGSVWAIWEGGIAIFGALIGGAVGAWIGCRWRGVRFASFADAMAPGMLLAQAIGRFGNWFNQELFGLPTDLPWGLEIDESNPAFPPGLEVGTLFHPTFLYEVVWNLLGVAFLLWLGHRFRVQWGKLFATYLIWYCSGRILWESIRIDPSELILGLRTNVWAAILGVLLGVIVIIVQTRRHPGLEPSPYVAGREWNPSLAVVESQDDSTEFVDLSEPPAADLAAGQSATSATSSTKGETR